MSDEVDPRKARLEAQTDPGTAEGNAAGDARHRQTDQDVLGAAMWSKIAPKILGGGELAFPCIPALVDRYLKNLLTIAEALGKPEGKETCSRLREALDSALRAGWADSPYNLLVIKYQSKPLPQLGIGYSIRWHKSTMEQHYNNWIATRKPPLFGKLADRKVLHVAAELAAVESAPKTPVLDVGAGTGRNALVLGRLGYPVDALEPVPAFADILRKAAEAEKAPIRIFRGNILDDLLDLPKARYKLIVMTEVVAAHFFSIDQIRHALTKLCDALAPGGALLLNAFLAVGGYEPDLMARQVSQCLWSCIFKESELEEATSGLPLERIANESVLAYEKAHLPPEEWPPTVWFADWAQGLHVFDLREGTAPIELRWLTYRRL